MADIRVLKNKNIVLGVSGGIAAYKVADLASRLVKAGALVDVIMTPSATHFIGPITFQALTHRPVVTEMFALLQETEIGHVSLGQRADLMIVAPATANTLAKLAHGLADNMLTTTALACRATILSAPAMESGMWQNPATQANVALLRERGMHFIGPEEGRLASGGSGAGRMSGPVEILEAARWLLGRQGALAGCRVAVTAGGTQEPIDPVRFVGNHSSGKMGYALVTAARDRGAETTLIHAATALPTPYGVQDVPVGTARQMRDAVLAAVPTCDVLLMAAAVADYHPVTVAEQKIKKGESDLTVELTRNPDILMEVAQERERHGRPRVVVGFAAETQDLLDNARQKLIRKRAELFVANDVSAADSGFAVDTNRVTLLDAQGGLTALPLLSKQEVAEMVLDRVAALLQAREGT